jgi:ELWxxDGT repeat protein
MLRIQKITTTSRCWRAFLVASLFLGLAGLPGWQPARAQIGGDPNPSLVRDINQEPATISTSHIVSMNGALYFSVYNYSSTCQLWKSDGTPQGTQMFLEMSYLPAPNAYVVSFGCLNLIAVNQKLFFINSDPENGSELWVTDGTSGGTRLVEDFVPGTEGIAISNWVEANNELFFLAYDSVHGASLWKTDGSQAGSVLLYSANTLASRTHANVIPYTPPLLFNNQGLVYFIGNDPDTGRELWRSDGTPQGTQLVKDINPGTGSSDPALVSTYNDTVYFSANDGAHGVELWKSNGSTNGTQLVKDIYPGTSTGFISLLASLNGKLYILADDGVHGSELWFSDGTEAGTILLKDINPGKNYSFPGDARVFGDLVLFTAQDGTHGYELWRSDGTPAGTYMVEDILPGAESSSPKLLAELNGQFYLVAQDTSGWQLYKTNGSLGDANVVSPLNSTVVSISSPAVLNGYLYFNVYAGGGSSLWRSDGSAGGTSLILTSPYVGSLLGRWNDGVLYSKNLGNEYELWLVDGPPQNPVLLASGAAVREFVVLGNAFYFITTGYQQPNSLWRSDGSQAGTQVVRDISGTDDSVLKDLTPTTHDLFFGARANPLKEDVWEVDVNGESRTIVPGYIDLLIQLNSQTDLLELNGQLLFHIDYQNPDFTPGLWRSDGTPGGTELIKGDPVRFRFVQLFTRVDSLVYFINKDLTLTSNETLWRTDGTTAGTMMLLDLGSTGSLSSIIDVDGTAFAFGQLSTGSYFLNVSDGTPPGTQFIHEFSGSIDANQMLAWNGSLYFVEVNKLWVSDGTTDGSTILGQFLPAVDPQSSAIMGFTGLGSQVFFAAGDAEHGNELWKTDGSAAGTLLVKDIYSGMMGSDPQPVATIGSALYFTADDGIHGRELWRSDGTQAGTTLVKDILPGAEGAQPDSFTLLENSLYFAANDGQNGRELWRSDGTEAGTSLVKDILPGAGGSAPQVSALAGRLYLSANDGEHGIEPWISDGTEIGTILMSDVNPGQASSKPDNFTYWHGQVYFTAADFDHGRELWAYDLGFTPQSYMPLLAR